MGKSLRSKREKRNRANLRKEMFNWEVDEQGKVIPHDIEKKNDMKLDIDDSKSKEVKLPSTGSNDSDEKDPAAEKDVEMKISDQIEKKYMRSSQKKKLRRKNRMKRKKR